MDSTSSFTRIKNVVVTCSNMFGQPDIRTVLDAITTGHDDFVVDHVRFIHSDWIHETISDMLFGDYDKLGRVDPDFICRNSSLNEILVNTCIKHCEYVAIGKALDTSLEGGWRDLFINVYIAEYGYEIIGDRGDDVYWDDNHFFSFEESI